MPSGSAPSPLQDVGLDEVLRRIGGGFVVPLSGPAPDRVRVRAVAIRDPLEEAQPAGTLLLAPGLQPGLEGAGASFDRLAAVGVPAVVVRGATVDPGLPEDLAVLSIDPSMAWDRVFLLLSAALDSALTEVAGGPAGAAGDRIGDLFALTDALSGAVGGSVLILDPQNRVLAFSGEGQPTDEWRRGTILGRRVPEEWERRFRREGLYDRMRQPGEVVAFELPDTPEFRPRRAVGVHAGGRVIGTIAAAEGEVPFDARTDAVLREASRMAALHLLRHATRQAVGAHRQQERLRELLAGDGDPASTLLRLGLAVDQHLAVVAATPRDGATDDLEAAGRQLRMRIPDGLAAVTTTDGTRIYLLLSGPPDRLAGLSTMPAWFGPTTSTGGRPLIAGVSRPVVGAEAVPSAREEADRVLDAVEQGIVAADIASPEQTWPFLALSAAEELVLTTEGHQYGRAAALQRHDESHKTDYVATLATFLNLRGDSTRTAEVMHIHVNTLRYRVRRACEIAGIDLDDPVERLVLELQLRALQRR